MQLRSSKAIYTHRRQTKLTTQLLHTMTPKSTSPLPTLPPSSPSPNHNTPPTPPQPLTLRSPRPLTPRAPDLQPHDSPPFLTPPAHPSSPPPTPIPTKWRCRTCRALYPLAATRRCLSHTCATIVWPSMLITQRQGLNPVNPARPRRRLEWPIRPVLPPRRWRRKGPQKRDCWIEFKYAAWAKWAAWRRAAAAAAGDEEGRAEVVGDEEERRGPRKRSREEAEDGDGDQLRSEKETRRAVKRRKEVAYVEGRYDCERDCDFPTECKHAVFRAYKARRADHNEEGRGFVYVGEREL
ncbi:hypothetical protein B0T18DRAFT_427014 [Schizothecium vesticola]|uniref:Uncharacterized protein n=1 Tax=Schizothecium vesticola TaxID=314040 RepID=A0AA40F7E0_9PEZI|nr:hypothetical protein B0T18DRAFT_427014 [Schizothecium vesticola]